MPKYRVSLETWAGGTIDVETDATDPEDILEEALAEGMPGICAQCSGWGRDHSLEIGDEWEPVLKTDGTPTIYTEDGELYKESDG